MAQCCRCNRTGSCRRCACVRASRIGLGPVQMPARYLLQVPLLLMRPNRPTTLRDQLRRLQWSGDTTVETTLSSIAYRHPCSGSSLTSNCYNQVSSQDSNQCPPDELQLPPYLPMNPPSFLWGSLNADEFSHALEGTFSEVVHWRRIVLKYQRARVAKILFESFRDYSLLLPLPHQWNQWPPSSYQFDFFKSRIADLK